MLTHLSRRAGHNFALALALDRCKMLTRYARIHNLQGKRPAKGKTSRKGVKEDTFGIDDEHWNVYRMIVCALHTVLNPDDVLRESLLRSHGILIIVLLY